MHIVLGLSTPKTYKLYNLSHQAFTVYTPSMVCIHYRENTLAWPTTKIKF